MYQVKGIPGKMDLVKAVIVAVSMEAEQEAVTAVTGSNGYESTGGVSYGDMDKSYIFRFRWRTEYIL